MTKTSTSLQDLRRRLYVKAKAETSWRFWGLYVHICKMETLRQAYVLAKENDGAPGVDRVTFAAIEVQGVETFLEQIRDELVRRIYKPLPARKREIPKDGGKVRVLSIPTWASYCTSRKLSLGTTGYARGRGNPFSQCTVRLFGDCDGVAHPRLSLLS